MVPLNSSTPAVKVKKEILASKTRKNIFEEKMNETIVLASQLSSLSDSILSQLQVNNSKKTVRKQRIDTNEIGGKVLNEASTRAIVQAKENKKSEKIEKQIANLEKKAFASDEKAKKLLESVEKNRIKALDLKKKNDNTKPKASMNQNNENKVISCRGCNIKLNENNHKNWLACENCDNWFCFGCKENINEEDTCVYC